LIIFALMLWRIACNPVKFRDLRPYGIGLKVAYCGVVFYHKLTTGIPDMWMPFAWLDLVFMILFFLAWTKVKGSGQTVA